ncbi:MAG: IclR family transcriptional regulator [Phyllobacteriaceae bacterium]|nr:IclR family transcriptional regulator [Phyllobacteriaceae bacterium]
MSEDADGPRAEPGRRGKVQSAEYGLLVLKTLGRAGGALTLTALAERLDASPAKVHRYLASLKQAGFVRQEQDTARYVLGEEAIALGIAAMRRADVLVLAGPVLVELTERFDVSCFVAIMGNRGPTILRWEEPFDAVTVNVRPGAVMPMLWSATGRAFAAFSESPDVARAVREDFAAGSAVQRREFPDLAAVDRALAEIRVCGCAVVRDVLIDGVSAVAAPIFDGRSRVHAVLTALGTSGRIDPDPASRLARAVCAAAERISLALGGGVDDPALPAAPVGGRGR